jgi:hypothetical protein
MKTYGKNKKLLYALAATLFVIALSASATGIVTSQTNSLTTNDASDNEQPDPPPHENIIGSLNVSGTSSISVEPDQGIVVLGVHTEAPTASETTQMNAEIINRIKETLLALGIPENKIRTISYSLYPRYVSIYDENDHYVGQRLVGYALEHRLKVTVDDLSKIGEVIDTAVNAGANRINSVQFTISNAGEIRKRALREAALAAREKAEIIADVLGVDILGVTSAGEGNPWSWVRPYNVQLGWESSSGSSPPTSIQPGLAEVSARVNVTFAIG